MEINNNDIVNAYSQISKEYAEKFYNELDLKPIDRKLYDLFSERIPKKGLCAEIGCGPGEVSVYLHNKGLNIIGVDKSKEMIAVAKKLNQDITFEVNDVFNLTYAQGSFYGIIAPYLIVNFSDDEIIRSMHEIYRVLKENGELLLSFHIGNNEEMCIEHFFKKDNKIKFIMHSVEKIKELLEDTKFKINEIITKTPYEGEQTNRAYIFAKKIV